MLLFAMPMGPTPTPRRRIPICLPSVSYKIIIHLILQKLHHFSFILEARGRGFKEKRVTQRLLHTPIVRLA